MWPPAVIMVAAVIATLSPEVSPLLVYDRELVKGGELWRLATGHLVHFSLSHLSYDLAGLLIPWGYCRRNGYRGVVPVAAVALFAITGSIYLFQPEMARYGGLSGIANALIVFAACQEMSRHPERRWWWIGILACCCGNVIYELVTAGTSLVCLSGKPFVPATTAHAIGAATGAIAGTMPTWRHYCERPLPVRKHRELHGK